MDKIEEKATHANDIAYAVIDVSIECGMGDYVPLNFRYGIAQKLWEMGYRKVEEAKEN